MGWATGAGLIVFFSWVSFFLRGTIGVSSSSSKRFFFVAGAFSIFFGYSFLTGGLNP
jgi:hypothetical protein